MRQLFNKRYLKDDRVRVFYDGLDGIYLVADKSWFESDSFHKFMWSILDTTYSVMYSPLLSLESQLEIVEDYEEVIL